MIEVLKVLYSHSSLSQSCFTFTILHVLHISGLLFRGVFLSLPITVVTVAFGTPEVVSKWVREWSKTGVSCVISDNGNQIPGGLCAHAKILPFAGNTGFGAGINRAVQESETPIVLITNPDTLPESSGSLTALADYHTQGSFTGGFTVDCSNREVHSTGIWPTLSWVRSQIFKPAGTLFCRDRIDWLQGSLIMVHREDFLKLGGFSGGYPLFFEDVDICARAAKSGMGIDLCRDARFIHNEGSGSDRVTATRLSCYHWGMLQFFLNNDPSNASAARRYIIAKCMARLIAYSVLYPDASKGYLLALKSIQRGTPPTLPKARL
jgi:GT2 family glycosyltransferase